MSLDPQVNVGTQFQILSQDERQEVTLAALSVLERTGVVIHSDEALDILEESGARVEGTLAYIPSSVVGKARVTAPVSFTLYGR